MTLSPSSLKSLRISSRVKSTWSLDAVAVLVGGQREWDRRTSRGAGSRGGRSVYPKMELGCQIVDQRREDWLCYRLGLDRFIVAFS
jgi:hypothetical protein